MIIRPKIAIMLNYASVNNETYYAPNYASIMCQALLAADKKLVNIRILLGSYEFHNSTHCDRLKKTKV